MVNDVAADSELLEVVQAVLLNVCVTSSFGKNNLVVVWAHGENILGHRCAADTGFQ